MPFHPLLSDAVSRASLAWRASSSVDGSPLSLYSGAKSVIEEVIDPEALSRLEEQLSDLGEARTTEDRQSRGEKVKETLKALVQETRQRLTIPSEEVREVLVRLEAGINGYLERAHEPEIPSVVEEVRGRMVAGTIARFPEDQRSIPWSERVDPLEFLKTQYREYLVAGGADSNRLSQSDLAQVDPRLLSAARNRVQFLRRSGEEVTLESIVPPLSDLPAPDAFTAEQSRLHGARAYRTRRRK